MAATDYFIELNDTFLVIGKIIYIQIDNDVVSEVDFLHLGKAATVCSN